MGGKRVSFITGSQDELLYSLPAPVTKNTYTAQAVLSVPAATGTAPLCVVDANYFRSVPNGVGRGLYLKAKGTIATTSAATFTGVLGLDATPGTLANSVTYWPILAPTAATTCLWDLEAWYTCQQVGGNAGLTLQVNGEYRQSVVATGVLSTAPQSVTAMDPTKALYVELWGTWSASAAGNTTTLQEMFLFGLN